MIISVASHGVVSYSGGMTYDALGQAGAGTDEGGIVEASLVSHKVTHCRNAVRR